MHADAIYAEYTDDTSRPAAIAVSTRPSVCRRSRPPQAYPYDGTADPGAEFPFTPAGQLAYTRAIIAAVRRLGAAGGGLAWWGAEYFSFTSGAGWTGLWGRDGVALPALTSGWT